MTLYVVVEDTSGAHEAAGCYSVWSTPDAALAEAQRLNLSRRIVPYGDPHDSTNTAPAQMNRASGSGGYYVVAITADESREQPIG